jgi:hypothetical protein
MGSLADVRWMFCACLVGMMNSLMPLVVVHFWTHTIKCHIGNLQTLQPDNCHMRMDVAAVPMPFSVTV